MPIVDSEYLELTNQVLIEINDMMTFISKREGKNVEELFPTFPAWSRKETRLIKESLADLYLLQDLIRHSENLVKHLDIILGDQKMSGTVHLRDRLKESIEKYKHAMEEGK